MDRENWVPCFSTIGIVMSSASRLAAGEFPRILECPV